jgi:hypothetical protein
LSAAAGRWGPGLRGLDGNDVAILWNLIHNCTRYTFDNAAVFWFPTDWSKRDTGPTFATTFSS